MDYIFYRIYTYYKKKDHIPVMMGIYFLFVLELTLLFLCGIIFNFSSGGIFSNQFIEKDKFWTIFIVFIISMFVWTTIHYIKKGKVTSIVKRFDLSSLNQKIKTWQIFLLPILIIFISVGLIVLLK